jgi:hypothetical protein
METALFGLCFGLLVVALARIVRRVRLQRLRRAVESRYDVIVAKRATPGERAKLKRERLDMDGRRKARNKRKARA